MNLAIIWALCSAFAYPLVVHIECGDEPTPRQVRSAKRYALVAAIFGPIAIVSIICVWMLIQMIRAGEAFFDWLDGEV